MLVLNFDYPDPIGTFRGTSFLSFDGGLFSNRIVLRYSRLRGKKMEFLLKIELTLTN
ncbi:hypothetical protein [Wolbachia endosymbiont of Brugia malayi]|uniref:hypothetical protein n=1 Tax=Wolbachia endosymbiont of Brugia malayi TaxID=80849 RepID=UPI0003088213|nr:hypothetical protein [Wolbachia endosymbiont of Brugia malayi]